MFATQTKRVCSSFRRKQLKREIKGTHAMMQQATFDAQALSIIVSAILQQSPSEKKDFTTIPSDPSVK